MGTSIELQVGGVSLDYAKNHMGNNWGYLFQDGDLARRPCEEIDYKYYQDNPEAESDLAESELAFVRPLARVIPRLKLIGYSLERAEAEYDALVSEAMSIADYFPDGELQAEYLAFVDYCALVNLVSLAELADDYVEFETEDREIVAQGRFAGLADRIARIPKTENSGSYWSEASFVSSELCILSPGSMLMVLGLNSENANAEVMWQFGNLVNNGYVEREAFVPGALRSQATLIATEGASDARILRRALDFLRPDIADFFRFIDGDERHHFWGTGNLVKFAEGLLRIDIQNQVLFVLDNDAEGAEAYGKLENLGMPTNLRAMILPALDDLRKFPALGPEGLSECDINGRAAAIECYLDLDLPDYPPARVIWSNYRRETDTWHGALEHKESYDRFFMKQDRQALLSGKYNSAKLGKVLDALTYEVTQLLCREPNRYTAD
jgi:hypothetical protein